MKHKRTKRVHLRITPIEKSMLDQLQVYTGLDSADVIRQLIRKERAAYRRANGPR
jgi:hypothetical protein